MKRYKEQGFQERIDTAARARDDVLAQLRAKPPVDEAVVAERSARRLEGEATAAAKRLAGKLAADEIKAAKRTKAMEAVSLQALPMPEPTDADRKAKRDARYSARKSRTAL